MKGIAVVVVVVVLEIMWLHQGYGQEPVLTPSEYVAYEGQPEFTFQCTAGVQYLLVRVDGKQLGDESLSQRGITIPKPMRLGDTIYQRNITISAIQANRNTTLQCIGSENGEVAISNSATFVVQGLLEPVSQLTSEYYNKILTWTPPFTLDITDLDPDITYRVCSNATNTCVDTADTSYIFPTTCFPVEYSVNACNPVGCSEAATLDIAFKFVHEPTEITMVSCEFLYMSSSEDNIVHLIVQFIFKSDGNCTGVYRVNFTGQFNRRNVISPTPIIPTVDENGTVTITLNKEDGVVPNEKFTGNVGPDQMTPNRTEMMMDTNFTTFDVQETDVTHEGGSITVICTFARGSEALGCRAFVFLRDMPSKSPDPKDALRADNTSPTSTITFTGLQNGTYIVDIVDIEVDGTSDNEKYAFVHRVIITDVPAPTPPGSTPAPSSPTVPSASPTSSSPSDSSSLIGIIAGVLGATVLVFLMIAGAVVVCCVVWKWKKGKRSICPCGESSEESKVVTVHMSRIANYGNGEPSNGGEPVNGETAGPRPPPYQDMDP